MKRTIKLLGLGLVLSCMLACNQVQTPSWNYAVVCDTRGSNDTTETNKTCINDSVLQAIALEIVKQKCELVIVPGDLTNGWWANCGTPYKTGYENWKAAMKPVYDAGIPVYAVRGNHEYGKTKKYPPNYPYTLIPDTAVNKAFYEVFGVDNPTNGPEGEKGLTYYVRHKNAFFVGMDEYVQNYKPNMPWLKATLNKVFNKEETPHLFTYGHNPAFAVTHKDCMGVDSLVRDNFWNLIGDKGSKIYFCGHDHTYNRAMVKDKNGNEIYQALVGSCGAPMKPWNGKYTDPRVELKDSNNVDYGFMVVSIADKKVTASWNAWDAAGAKNWKVADKFSYNLN